MRPRRAFFLSLGAAIVLPLIVAAEPAKQPGVRFLYLVRHATYDRDEHADDRKGNGLNALGRAQAKRLGARLAASGIHFDAFVASDFLRARETADLVGAALSRKPEIDASLHECMPATKPEERALPPIAACERQLEEVWKRYVVASPDADRHDLLVAHGNVLRWIAARAIGAPLDAWERMDIGNATIGIIAVSSDGHARLMTWSDAAHLSPAEQTWLGPSPVKAADMPRKRR